MGMEKQHSVRYKSDSFSVGWNQTTGEVGFSGTLSEDELPEFIKTLEEINAEITLHKTGDA